MARFWTIVPLVLATAAPAAAADPWRLSGAEKSEAQRRHQGYWFEHYARAVDILDKSRGSVEEAVVLLKLAIDGDQRSGAGKTHPVTKGTFDYFPYYYLAVALAQKEDFPSAQRCLDREDRNEMSRSSMAGRYDALRTDVVTLTGRAALLARADEVLSLEKGTSPVVLTVEGRGTLPEIRERKGALAKAGKSEVKAASAALVEAIFRLGTGEIRARSAILSKLAGDSWAAAFTDPAHRFDSSACQTPAGGPSNENAVAVVAALKKCADVALKAERRAGEHACQSFVLERKGVEAIRDNLVAWSRLKGRQAPIDALPEVPGWCIPWTGAPPARVAESFAVLEGERAGYGQTLDARRKAYESEIDEVSREVRKTVEESLARLPDVSVDCARNLQLGQTASKSNEFRQTLSRMLAPGAGPPPASLSSPGPLVRDTLDSLAARVKAGVAQLQIDAICEGVEKADLDRLPGAMNAWLQEMGGTNLSTLCAVAKGADRAVQACWEKNTEVVRSNLARTISLVEAVKVATTAGACTTGGDERNLACVDRDVQSLRASQVAPAGGAAAWVRQARERINGAQDCLGKFRGLIEACYLDVSRRIKDHAGRAASVEAALGKGAPDTPNPGLDRLRQVLAKARGTFEAQASVLGKVRTLYGQGETPPGSRVRAVLDEAGLSDNVPGGLWSLVDTEGAWTIVRDVAVVPAIAMSERVLEESGPSVARLGPLAALTEAFGVFGTGDLEGAILSLRRAEHAGLIPDRGDEAALAHAALSYFLHTKHRALAAMGAQDEVARSLEQDAAREAGLAAKAATAGFELPVKLFASQEFRKRYSEYARSEVR